MATLNFTLHDRDKATVLGPVALATFNPATNPNYPEGSLYATDAVGDFKHFLRNERRWRGAVDIAWPHLKPFAEMIVRVAVRRGA